jgi:acyl-coenzyme A synthetase/AMP-(fatty) acid ligase
MAAKRSGINVLHGLFFRSAKNFPDNIAVTFSGDAVESITYRDLNKKVENLSTCFSEIFSKNEVIGIYSSDCLNLPALLLAVMDASAAFYPISTTLQPRKVLESINHLSIRYVLVDNGLLQNIMNLNDNDHDNTFIRIPLEIIDRNSLHEVRFTVLKVTTRNQPCVVNWSKDLAYAMQTSGTTGDPKAVFVPHSCIVPNIFHLRWAI